jgi:hypothetical protein
MLPRMKALAATLIAIALLAGCSRVTPDNYARVNAGMTRDEVYAILGKPDVVSGGGIGSFTLSSETWRGGKQTIEVTFAGDKVAVKAIRASDEAKP